MATRGTATSAATQQQAATPETPVDDGINYRDPGAFVSESPMMISLPFEDEQEIRRLAQKATPATAWAGLMALKTTMPEQSATLVVSGIPGVAAVIEELSQAAIGGAR